MIAIAVLIVCMLCDCFKSRRRLATEILVLRHQLNVLQQRTPRRLHLRWADRALFIWLYRRCPRIQFGTSFHSPWQNGYVERLIGSIRRECTDHLLVFNAEHLRRILAKYTTYYNEVRTHVSLGKDAPCRRPVERFGDIVAHPVLGGLHHRYARI
jgi:hypothetical protein